MSKKSHPGDGSHGKGTKGMKRPFDEVFEAPSATQRAETGKDEESSEPAKATDDEG